MNLPVPQRQLATDCPVSGESAEALRAILQHAAAQVQAGRTQAAIEALKTLLPAQSQNAAQCRMIGALLCGANALPEACDWFARAVSLAPEDIETAGHCATVLFQLGRLEEALEYFDLAARPPQNDPRVFYNRGLVLHRLGRLQEAANALDEALRRQPDDAETLRAAGLILRDIGRHEAALTFFERAFSLRKDFYDCRLDHANLLQKIGRYDAAANAYAEALALFPGDADLLNNRGAALRELGDLDAALASFDAALAVRPDFPHALFNRGTVLLKKAPPQAALASYEAALALRPVYADAHVGRGVALKELERFDEAEAAFDRALAQQPGSPHALNNKGALRLLRGDFANGFEGYEYRWLAAGLDKTSLRFPIPEWRGEAGRHVLVYDEQGFGDTFQFSRYLPLLADAGAQVTFFCRSSLIHLIERIDPRVRVIDDFGPEAKFDCQIALSSLPRGFGTRLDTIPAFPSYLTADPQKITEWRQRMAGTAQSAGARKFKIGLCWQGNPDPRAEPSRSLPLAAFAPLKDLRAARLISLQKPETARGAGAADFGIEVMDEVDSGRDAFRDTAAIMQSLDLIVTCDTSIAHLAGALGRPVFLLLRRVPDWRWLLEREDSPWYPSMRLFRQKERGNWSEVITRVRAAINALGIS